LGAGRIRRPPTALTSQTPQYEAAAEAGLAVAW
jgi:hypothetical protein